MTPEILCQGKGQLSGATFQSLLNESKDKTRAAAVYLFGASVGSAVEDACSSPLSSVVACSGQFSDPDEDEEEAATGAGGGDVPVAEATDEGCVAAGAVLGWRISNT